MKNRIKLLIALVWISALCVIGSEPVWPKLPEPTISQAEALVLNNVQALVDTDPAAAVAQLRGVITPESSAALDYALAGCEQRAGRLEKAVEALTSALAKMPEFVNARQALARLYAGLGDFPAAAVECRLLLDSPGTDKAELWRLLGQIRLQQQHVQAAVAAFSTALALEPADKESELGLLQAFIMLEDFARARPLLETALAEQPLSADLWLLMAKINLHGKDQEQAAANLETARRLGAEQPEVLQPLAELLLSMGLADEAAAVYSRLAQTPHPPAPALLRAVNYMLTAGQTTKAAELHRLLKLHPEQLDAEQKLQMNIMAAGITAASGKPRDALALYRKLLEEQPLNGSLLLAAGQLLRQLGELEEAAFYYQRAQRAEPDLAADALLFMAELAVDKDEYTQAVRFLEQSLRLRHRDYVLDYLNQLRRLQLSIQ